MPGKPIEFAIVPDSRLEQLVDRMPRRNRRLLFATMTGAPTRRRTRLQRRLQRRLGR